MACSPCGGPPWPPPRLTDPRNGLVEALLLFGAAFVGCGGAQTTSPTPSPTAVYPKGCQLKFVGPPIYGGGVEALTNCPNQYSAELPVTTTAVSGYATTTVLSASKLLHCYVEASHGFCVALFKADTPTGPVVTKVSRAPWPLLILAAALTTLDLAGAVSGVAGARVCAHWDGPARR
jgi:hypothetical protein